MLLVGSSKLLAKVALTATTHESCNTAVYTALMNAWCWLPVGAPIASAILATHVWFR